MADLGLQLLLLMGTTSHIIPIGTSPYSYWLYIHLNSETAPRSSLLNVLSNLCSSRATFSGCPSVRPSFSQPAAISVCAPKAMGRKERIPPKQATLHDLWIILSV